MKEQVEKFAERLKTDQSLAEKVKNSGTTDDVVKIAKAEGFDFSAEELRPYLEKSESLNIEDLDKISGGTSQATKASPGGGRVVPN